jgi:hypothetical protein
MAILLTLEALGHDAFTMKEFTLLELVVVEEAFYNKSISLLRSPYIK